ncbi:ATP-binding cassette domain-containing protein [Clostridium estertheticum]|uniref:ATP-binding cassette domain-containing protein n=1 Tax=Clostridium estertheticum TaxID=238834 RepID=UPI0013EEC500|nr:ATP-binding cassette domain-containing protein [Clostridium estertheticum]MBZ9606850.1 ATP-binding cassette domain-containing protein [Clostridium estertheticum]
MNNVIVKTTAVSKIYKGMKALDTVDMTINKGQIYGLIGLNGAGKTTLMRVIAGLCVKDRGRVELFGENDEMTVEANRKRIGCLIETPGIYVNKTTYENLEIERIQKGIPGKECIERVLNDVGLVDLKNKKVRNFSKGMKQKLGIAMALLSEPEFLMLDEPTNGLDPIAIIQIRELLKKLNIENGVTMLISSHILAELHQLANCYGIIHNGKLIEQIIDSELEEKCKKLIHIKVDDAAKASVVLNTKLQTRNFEVLPNNIIKLYDYVDNAGKVSKVLSAEGISVEEIMPMGDDLEDYFTKVIGGELDD